VSIVSPDAGTGVVPEQTDEDSPEINGSISGRELVGLLFIALGAIGSWTVGCVMFGWQWPTFVLCLFIAAVGFMLTIDNTEEPKTAEVSPAPAPRPIVIRGGKR
jgi:fatty acid desaturase